MTDDLSQCRGFQWDEGNAEKNWIQHQVSQGEAEQVFFNRPLVVVEGEQRTEFTRRYYALGQTDARRLLFIVFTPTATLDGVAQICPCRIAVLRPQATRESDL